MSAITQQEDKQYERKGLIFALLVHGLLLLIFFFWVVLKKTDGEGDAGSGGTPINFGFNELGSGDNNSMDQVATQTEQTAEESAQQPEEAVTQDANLTANNPTAETVVSETQKPTTASTTPTTKPAQTTTTAANPNVQTGATNKPGVSSGDGDSKQAGNQGNPNGTLNSKNYYGTPGNGTGGTGNLKMDGWHLEASPKIENTDKESGKVVFAIKIDSEGEILSLVVKEKQVSEALVKKCEYQIRTKMEFVKNLDNGSTAPYSTGDITFVFQVN